MHLVIHGQPYSLPMSLQTLYSVNQTNYEPTKHRATDPEGRIVIQVQELGSAFVTHKDGNLHDRVHVVVVALALPLQRGGRSAPRSQSQPSLWLR